MCVIVSLIEQFLDGAYFVFERAGYSGGVAFLFLEVAWLLDLMGGMAIAVFPLWKVLGVCETWCLSIVIRRKVSSSQIIGDREKPGAGCSSNLGYTLGHWNEPLPNL